MGVLETWLEKKHPNAELILRTHRDAWLAGHRPQSTPEVDAILGSILDHARHGTVGIGLLFDRSRLARAVTDLSDEDISTVQRVARTVAIEAAERVLHGESDQGPTSLASHLKIEMRKGLRQVCRQYGISTSKASPKRGDPSSEGESWAPAFAGVELPRDLAASAEGSALDYEEFAAGTGFQDGRDWDGHGVLGDGHSLSGDPKSVLATRPYWEGLAANRLCIRCAQPRAGVKGVWRLSSERDPAKRSLKLHWIDNSSPGFPYCSNACEAEFRGPRYAPEILSSIPDPERMARARDARLAREQAVKAQMEREDQAREARRRARRFLNSPTSSERVADPTVIARAIFGPSPRGTQPLRVLTGNLRRPAGEELRQNIENLVANRVLNALEREIWERRNDGRGSVGKHVAELRERGIKWTANNYRQRRQVVKDKVNRAVRSVLERKETRALARVDTSQRRFEPDADTSSQPVRADVARRILRGSA